MVPVSVCQLADTRLWCESWRLAVGCRWDGWWQDEYSLLTLPASALMLLRPTVAPARPCRVPREVREFMAPALEPAAVPAGGKTQGSRGGRREGWDTGSEKTENHMCYISLQSYINKGATCIIWVSMLLGRLGLIDWNLIQYSVTHHTCQVVLTSHNHRILSDKGELIWRAVF